MSRFLGILCAQFCKPIHTHILRIYPPACCFTVDFERKTYYHNSCLRLKVCALALPFCIFSTAPPLQPHTQSDRVFSLLLCVLCGFICKHCELNWPYGQMHLVYWPVVWVAVLVLSGFGSCHSDILSTTGFKHIPIADRGLSLVSEVLMNSGYIGVRTEGGRFCANIASFLNISGHC